MNGTYDPGLLLASCCIAALTCYALFDLGARVAAFEGRRRVFWLAAGALAIGSGSWSAQALGLHALRTSAPLSFDLGLSLLAGFVGAVAAWAVLRAIAGRRLGLVSGVVTILVAGFGLNLGHYLGLQALRMNPPIAFGAPLSALAALIALTAAATAVVVGRALRELPPPRARLSRLAAAVVTGALLSAAHLSIRAAVHFAPDAACAPDNYLAGTWLGGPLAMVVCSGLAAVLLLSLIDARALADRRFLQRKRDDAERLRRITYYDPVTGLPNRSQFSDLLIRHMITVGGHAPRPFSVVYAELRGYRGLIEHLGPERMNQILKSLARHLSQGLLEGDVLARLSREGFVFLMRDRGDEAGEVAMARVTARLGTLVQNNGETLRLSWSLGLSRYPDGGTSTQSLLRAAMKPIREIGAETRSAVVPLSSYIMA
jgi:diguanylate cyclase (GGDEF)-like protein